MSLPPERTDCLLVPSKPLTVLNTHLFTLAYIYIYIRFEIYLHSFSEQAVPACYGAGHLNLPRLELVIQK